MARVRSLLCTLAALAAGVTSAVTSSFHLPGINYNTRLGPDWAVACKDAATVARDMATLRQVADSVRLYSLSDCAQGEVVVPAAINAGLTVSLGLWVSEDKSVFTAELAQLKAMLQSHHEWFTSGKIADVHVGSEAIYRGNVTVRQNILWMNEVRDLMKEKHVTQVPVTIAEIGDTYLASPELVKVVDVVQANLFPFWEKVPVDKAVVYLRTRMELLLDLASISNKRVEIGETGWASQGAHPKAAETSTDNAGRYFSCFRTMAVANGWRFYYFEAFDSVWKAVAEGNDTVEAHFGLFTPGGTLKSEFETPTGCFADSNATNSSNNSSSNSTAGNNIAGNSTTGISTISTGSFESGAAISTTGGASSRSTGADNATTTGAAATASATHGATTDTATWTSATPASAVGGVTTPPVAGSSAVRASACRVAK